jgi:hypothetical protein
MLAVKLLHQGNREKYVIQATVKHISGAIMKCELPSGCPLQDQVRGSMPGLQPESLRKPIKTEVPVTTNGFTGLKKYLPGELPVKLEAEIEDFLFPSNKFSSDIVRRMEIHISQQYLSRSTIFVYFFEGKLIATWRSISKHSANEKLPIEAAKILTITDQTLSIARVLRPGDFFSTGSLPGAMPACEMGGLRVIDPETDPSISHRIRFKALSSILETCESEAFQQGYNSAFLTCMGSPQLEKLYTEKFKFQEFAEVSYGGEQVWKALIRKK